MHARTTGDVVQFGAVSLSLIWLEVSRDEAPVGASASPPKGSLKPSRLPVHRFKHALQHLNDTTPAGVVSEAPGAFPKLG